MLSARWRPGLIRPGWVAPTARRGWVPAGFNGGSTRPRARLAEAPAGDIVLPVSERPAQIVPRVLLSLVLVGGLLMGGRQILQRLSERPPPRQRDAEADLPPLVRAQTARRQNVTEHLRGYGVAQAPLRFVVTAEIEGTTTVVDTDYEPGTAVRPIKANGGSDPDVFPVLVELDASDVRDRLARARDEKRITAAELDRVENQASSWSARLTLAKNELASAQREYDRIAKLVPQTLSRSDLDRQELQVALRERQIEQIKASIQENEDNAAILSVRLTAAGHAVSLEERNLLRCTIRAPAAGRVVKRHVNRGDRVRPGDALFEIVSLERVEIPVALPAGRYAEVRVGAPVTLEDPRDDRTLHEGTVARRSPRIDASERTFFVFVEIEGTAHRNPIPPGTHVRARVEGRTHEDVVPVPRQAFLGELLFVARRDGEAGGEPVYEVVEREPTVARLLPGVALVSGGLEDGERFLVTNLESVESRTVGAKARVRLAPVDAAPGVGEPASPATAATATESR